MSYSPLPIDFDPILMLLLTHLAEREGMTETQALAFILRDWFIGQGMLPPAPETEDGPE